MSLVIPDPRPEAQRIEVDPTGTIPLGRYGRLKVTGLPVTEAEAAVRKALSRFIRNPEAISLTLVDARFFVFVTGKVDRSGFIHVSPGETVWQAVQRSGERLEGADLARVRLGRGGTDQPVDLAAFLAGRAPAPPPLEPGDVVFVPAAGDAPQAGSGRVTLLSREALEGKVFVIGSVPRPGLYDRGDSRDLLTTLAQAGGPSADAGLAGVRLLTVEASHTVDLAGALRGEAVRLPVLPERGGAILFVPPHREGGDPFAPQINVIGGVTRPGRYTVSGTTSVMEALALAGGPAPGAELDEVFLLREARGYTLVTQLDLERLLEEGGPVARLRLQPGDTLSVGQVRLDAAWRVVFRAISDVAIISAAVLIFAGTTR